MTRLAFAGTPEFARVALARLQAAGAAVALVLTQPDRPAGRGLKTIASPVKAFAVEHGIAVAQPRGLRLDGRFADEAAAAAAALERAAPDVVVVAAYGLILPPWLLARPRHGCLNIHASLLPRWRGAAPIQRAIEAGDAETGVTIMRMDAGLDTGDMLLVERTPIGDADTAATLEARLAEIGARLIVDAVRSLALHGSVDSARPREATTPAPAEAAADVPPLHSTPQPADGVTYAAKIAKSEAAIDWREPAAVIERRLRAFDPFPGARGTLDGEAITCWRGVVVDGHGRPGEILDGDAEALTVACGDGALRLTELQRPGGRRLAAADFLRGRRPAVGARFALPPTASIANRDVNSRGRAGSEG